MDDWGRIETDPEYWWREAADMYADAQVLLKNGGSRKAVVNFCHDAIERALKAVMAEMGVLSDVDKRHSLATLAKEAGVFDKVDVRLRMFLVKASGFHAKASYPAREVQEQTWTDNVAYTVILRSSRELCSLLLGMRGNANEGSGSHGHD